jgi:plasmid stability protein
VRTTLTLEDDVAAKLRSAVRRSGRSFKEVVNEVLRQGLSATPSSAKPARFTVRARDLGELSPGVQIDNVGDLLERVEGPLHR